MKKLLLFALMVSQLSTFAQRGYVRDKVHDKYEKTSGQEGMEKYNEWMQGKVLNAKVAPEYIFPIGLTMEVTSYRNGKKKDVSHISYYINTSTTNFATRVDEEKNKDKMLVIYDVKQNSMLMLDMKKMTGMAININAFMSGDAIAERERTISGKGSAKDSDHDCRKTGKTKTIQGYSCDEYICTDKDRNTRSEIWISKKLPVNFAQANAKGPMAAYMVGMRGMGGMLMEGNFYKNDALESSMLVTDLNPSANLKVVTGDYKLNSGF